MVEQVKGKESGDIVLTDQNSKPKTYPAGSASTHSRYDPYFVKNTILPNIIACGLEFTFF